jgi:hypothetical protein
MGVKCLFQRLFRKGQARENRQIDTAKEPRIQTTVGKSIAPPTDINTINRHRG